MEHRTTHEIGGSSGAEMSHECESVRTTQNYDTHTYHLVTTLICVKPFINMYRYKFEVAQVD